MNGIPLDLVIDWLQSDGHMVQAPVTIGAPLSAEIHTATVDSRLAQPDSLFVAMPGTRTDGHLFVDQAVQRGARAALVAADRLRAVQRSMFGSVQLLPVDDTLAAVQSLALRWRRQFPQLVRIGITGSNGKTSMKELVASILSQERRTVRSRGNYNSEIGLPLELLRIRPDDEFGVFEMGMHRPGRMRLLAELVDPDIALVTNIGRAHIGLLGSQDAIAREKREIFHLLDGSDTAIVPDDDPYSALLLEETRGRKVLYGRKTAGVREVRTHGLLGSTLMCGEGTIALHLPGAQMAANALGALTIARELGVGFEAIKEGVEAVQPVAGRVQIIRSQITVIEDSYNANPESMAAALELLVDSPSSGRRVAILGAMMELGEAGEVGHREVAERAAAMGLDRVVLYGDEFLASAAGVGNVESIPTDQFVRLEDVVSELSPGDVVLLKGSRALALERLLPAIEQIGAHA